MVRMKMMAVTAVAAALVAGPVAAPANASANHPCQYFADPYSRVCQLPFTVYCLIFPGQTVCH